MIREYETTFIIQPEISEEGREALCQKFDQVLARHGATRLMVDDWGKRRLAYEIHKFQKGHYLSLLYLDNGAAVRELEYALRIEESVLRFLTVQAKDEVLDIEARKAEAAEQERVQRERRAADKAAREEEERQRLDAEESLGLGGAGFGDDEIDPDALDDVDSDEIDEE